jgi:hypothetical protein
VVFIHAGIEEPIEIRNDLAHAGVGARVQFPARFEQFNGNTGLRCLMVVAMVALASRGVPMPRTTTSVLEPIKSYPERK